MIDPRMADGPGMDMNIVATGWDSSEGMERKREAVDQEMNSERLRLEVLMLVGDLLTRRYKPASRLAPNTRTEDDIFDEADSAD